MRQLAGLVAPDSSCPSSPRLLRPPRPRNTRPCQGSLSTSTTSVAVGSPIVVRGAVSPTHHTFAVLLQRRSGTRWTTVQTLGSGAMARSPLAGRGRGPRPSAIAGSARHPLAASRVIHVAIPAKPVKNPPSLPPPGFRRSPRRCSRSGRSASRTARALDDGCACRRLVDRRRCAPAGTHARPLRPRDGRARGARHEHLRRHVQRRSERFRDTAAHALRVRAPGRHPHLRRDDDDLRAPRIDRTVACSGGGSPNDLGTLAAGASGTLSTPVQVDDLHDATDVSVGGVMGCALHVTGIPVCWGANNTHGALGNGTRSSARTPTAVVGITDAIAVASGSSFGCALHRTGSVSCWGSEWRGAR